MLGEPITHDSCFAIRRIESWTFNILEWNWGSGVMNPCDSIISYEIESLLEVVKTFFCPPKKKKKTLNEGFFWVINNSVIKHLRFFWHLKPWTLAYILDSRFLLIFENKKFLLAMAFFFSIFQFQKIGNFFSFLSFFFAEFRLLFFLNGKFSKHSNCIFIFHKNKKSSLFF